MKETQVVVAAIIRNGRQILISQRPKTEFMQYYWEFPGGKVEYGENPEEALRREVKEELGIDILVESLFSITSHVYRNIERHIILMTYFCKVRGGEPQKLFVNDFKWVFATELPQFKFVDADLDIVEKLSGG